MTLAKARGKQQPGKAAAGKPEMTRRELRRAFDEKVERRLHMSGDEFLQRYDEGTLPDDPAVDDIAILVGGDEG